MQRMRKRGSVALMALVLVLGMALPTQSASASGRDFVEVSGPFSALCTLNDISGQESGNDNVWQSRYWFDGESKALLDGMVYTSTVRGDNHSVDFADGRTGVYHGWIDWNLYAGPDPATATGWYEAQYIEMQVGTGDEAHIEGHMTGKGYGDFAGQTMHGTLVVTEWWPSTDLCGGETGVAFFNATLTLRITGRP